MEFMQPIATTHLQGHSDWLYEIKYDGYRAQIIWTKNDIQIISRNNNVLSDQFPEIIARCRKIQAMISHYLPLQFDGELVILNHPFQANFAAIQKRGRLKNEQKINKMAMKRPATYIVFDLIQIEGKFIKTRPIIDRKNELEKIFKKIEQTRLQLIQTYQSYDEIARIVFNYKCEGIVAKRKMSKYMNGKGHRDWLKKKNWRTVNAILTTFDLNNGYFEVSVLKGKRTISIGKCKHGLNKETFLSLKELFLTNGKKEGVFFTLPPAVCASIHTLDLIKQELREPEFANVLPNDVPENSTFERLKIDLAMLPKINISNVDKVFWSKLQWTKGDLLIYMREIYPYIIPYLLDKALTIIRCPDGIHETCFFQKHLPHYAPKYIDFIEKEDKKQIICNRLESLIWLANHSAVEYHIPFQTVKSNHPVEIVFDLDPPTKERFPLAIKAANMIKQLLDQLNLISFIKTSGNKGLQIHIPIPLGAMNYDETAIFTEAIAKTVESEAPSIFTTERLKKKRHGRLYIDYIQHGRSKTIIAPYSPRKTEMATVATPLFWEEVQESLQPEQFTIKNVVERVQSLGCPWINNYEAAKNQSVKKLLKMIR